MAAYVCRNGSTNIGRSNNAPAPITTAMLTVITFDVVNGSDYYQGQVFMDVSSGTVTAKAGTTSSFAGLWLGQV